MQSFERAPRCLATVFAISLCTAATAAEKPVVFYLDISGGRILRTDAGKDVTVLLKDLGSSPDGIAVDPPERHIYWTNMGKAGENDGSIMRADYDGKNLRTIVASGDTFTPKQLKIDVVNAKLYWSDREGMRIMRANLDGSYLETLVETGKSDADRKDQGRWCVGIALDIPGNKVYWTQKGGDNARQGSIKRASLEIPVGEDPANRSDIEVLFAGLPEPIDLELNLDKRLVYWTDRGDNTISRAPMDPKKPFDASKRADREIIVTGLQEAIGIALDIPNNRLYYTTLRGQLGAANLDGKQATTLLTDQGSLTGIALAD